MSFTLARTNLYLRFVILLCSPWPLWGSVSLFMCGAWIHIPVFSFEGQKCTYQFFSRLRCMRLLLVSLWTDKINVKFTRVIIRGYVCSPCRRYFIDGGSCPTSRSHPLFSQGRITFFVFGDSGVSGADSQILEHGMTLCLAGIFPDRKTLNLLEFSALSFLWSRKWDIGGYIIYYLGFRQWRQKQSVTSVLVSCAKLLGKAELSIHCSCSSNVPSYGICLWFLEGHARGIDRFTSMVRTDHSKSHLCVVESYCLLVSDCREWSEGN